MRRALIVANDLDSKLLQRTYSTKEKVNLLLCWVKMCNFCHLVKESWPHSPIQVRVAKYIEQEFDVFSQVTVYLTERLSIIIINSISVSTSSKGAVINNGSDNLHLYYKICILIITCGTSFL